MRREGAGPCGHRASADVAPRCGRSGGCDVPERGATSSLRGARSRAAASTLVACGSAPRTPEHGRRDRERGDDARRSRRTPAPPRSRGPRSHSSRSSAKPCAATARRCSKSLSRSTIVARRARGELRPRDHLPVEALACASGSRRRAAPCRARCSGPAGARPTRSRVCTMAGALLAVEVHDLEVVEHAEVRRSRRVSRASSSSTGRAQPQQRAACAAKAWPSSRQRAPSR